MSTGVDAKANPTPNPTDWVSFDVVGGQGVDESLELGGDQRLGRHRPSGATAAMVSAQDTVTIYSRHFLALTRSGAVSMAKRARGTGTNRVARRGAIPDHTAEHSDCGLHLGPRNYRCSRGRRCRLDSGLCSWDGFATGGTKCTRDRHAQRSESRDRRVAHLSTPFLGARRSAVL